MYYIDILMAEGFTNILITDDRQEAIAIDLAYDALGFMTFTNIYLVEGV